ncbi:hypothetical protein MNEG_0599 [Monoraphidium neglectum]|uniref:Uncharacterized protein n=1 Tax=Monoraphidium neglectum TaxID=145388 RepID=A0A0D2MXZ3_9CHLO|nr:hypothetical protein MNEG_0599 [Monoraphidium neglectum]KIZ07350.1 hypothetical protein MNEG_0599 [Monoraphidium neglectum]|eukprot:XP_013906369.1 hypothetical protein MNEG_0599 [Monoraphidium neglectum]
MGGQDKATHRPISSKSEHAQALFDLGLLQAWGFEHQEAAVNFEAALRFDPKCTMCQWGLAYASGPYPNVVTGQEGDPFPVFTRSAAQAGEDHAKKALQMAKDAVEAGDGDTDLLQRELQLAELMARRFHSAALAVRGSGEQWYAQEREYAEALAALGERLGNDADVFALSAEAFMNLKPWDYYTNLGNLRPEGVKAEEQLLRALAIDEHHPLALHLHVHVTEAAAPTLEGAGGDRASWAGRGLGSAEKLAALAAQHGHLIHMPSHTFVRVGLYKTAVESNKKAYEFDVSRSTHCITPYLPEHNIHLLIYAASMGGQLHTAEAYAKGVRSLRERVGAKWISPGNDWTSLPLVLARYGEWRKVLQLSEPPQDARGGGAHGGPQYSQVVYRFVRVLAMAARADAYSRRALAVDDQLAYDLAAKGAKARLDDVTGEMRLLRAAIRAIPTETPTRPGTALGIYASSYQALGRMHGAVAEARIALMLNHTSQARAILQLQDALAEEEGLGYMEPPRSHQPTRQCLGFVLLQAGRPAEAADVFRKDLLQHPNNGWSLTGLTEALTAEGDSAGAAKASEQLTKAWADAGAEVQVWSSCPALAQTFDL